MIQVLIIAAVITAILAVNAMFVAGEFSLLGAPRSRLGPMARSGRRDAQHVLDLTGSMRVLDRSLTTAQIGITVTGLSMGMYGEHAVAELLQPLLQGLGGGSFAAAHAVASAIALTAMTCLHIVIGENMPKAIALQYPLSTALRVQAPLRFAMWLATPLLFVFERMTSGLLRLLGVQQEEHGHASHTTEDLTALIEEGGHGGVIGRRQTEILLHLVDFHDLLVRKLMVPRTHVVGLDADLTPDAVMEVLRQTEHTRYPVYEGDLDHVIGFVHVKDLMRATESGEGFDLRALARPAPHVPELAMAPRLLRELRDRRVQMAIVVDEHGGTAGIATFEDLIEEIFGEVQDEFDEEQPRIERLPGGGAILDGEARIDEVNRVLGLQLPEEEVDTVGGLVLQVLGRTARRGDVARVGGVTLKVESVRGFAVARVRLEGIRQP